MGNNTHKFKCYNKDVEQILSKIVTSITHLQDIIMEYNSIGLITRDLLQNLLIYFKFCHERPSHMIENGKNMIKNMYKNDTIIMKISKTRPFIYYGLICGEMYNYWTHPLPFSTHNSFCDHYSTSLIKYLPRYILSDVCEFELRWILSVGKDKIDVEDDIDKDKANVDKNKDKASNTNKSKPKIYELKVDKNYIFSFPRSSIGNLTKIRNLTFFVLFNKCIELGIDIDDISFDDICIQDYRNDYPILCIYCSRKLVKDMIKVQFVKDMIG